MGSKKTYVGTSVSRVIEDARLPDSVRTGLIAALHTNGEIVDHVLEHLVGSIGVRAERLYDFAKKGNYVHGLPSGQFTTPGEGWVEAVDAVLEVIHGAPVTIDYIHFGPPNSLHIGWMKLIADHGYSPVTNEFATLAGFYDFPAYLTDMVVVVPGGDLANVEPRTLLQWGVSPRAGKGVQRVAMPAELADMIAYSPPRTDYEAVAEYLRVWYEWWGGTVEYPAIESAYFDIPVTGYDANASYIHVRYFVGAVPHYWMYRVGSGTHASIEVLFDKEATINGEFFPFMYFRFNKVSEGETPASESYKDNVKLMKYIGMDFATIDDGINANPDIGDVEQAMLMFAVPANTTDASEQRYLWDFFNSMFLAQTPNLRFRSEAAADIYAWRSGTDLPAPGIVIQDQRFKMSLNNRGVYKIRKTGVIGTGKLGSHTSGMNTFMFTKTVVEWIEGDGAPYSVMHSVEVPVTYHWYRRQVAHNLYDEIQVVDLETRFHILNGYSTIGDDDDKILLIPLDHTITENYPIPVREALYSRALHYVFNSVVVIKVKWYQTGLFQVVMVIVAVVITYFTWGADGGSLIALAVAAGNYILVMQLIFIMLMEMLIARMLFKLFVKAVGIEWAFVFALILAAYGVYDAYGAGSLAGAPFASDMLSLSSGITSAIGMQIEANMADLLGESQSVLEYQKEQLKLLDTANDLLEQKHHLNPFVIFGETPGAYYNRTVHSGNIGVVAIGAISSFVDAKLMLPTIEESLGTEQGDR